MHPSSYTPKIVLEPLPEPMSQTVLPRLSTEKPWLAPKRLICNQGIEVGSKLLHRLKRCLTCQAEFRTNLGHLWS